MTGKKLSHFGQNLSKYRLKNTVMASFNTTVRQMTEMLQWPKCLIKNDRNVSAKKKTHLPFAVVMHWGPFLSVDLGPRNSNIHLGSRPTAGNHCFKLSAERWPAGLDIEVVRYKNCVTNCRSKSYSFFHYFKCMGVGRGWHELLPLDIEI